MGNLASVCIHREWGICGDYLDVGKFVDLRNLASYLKLASINNGKGLEALQGFEGLQALEGLEALEALQGLGLWKVWKVCKLWKVWKLWKLCMV